MKKLVLLFGRIISFLFPYRIKNKVSSFFNYFRTGYVTRGINSMGANSYFMKHTIVIGPQFISIGSNTSIGRRTIVAARKYENLECIPILKIGNNVRIGDDCHITAINKIVIGNDVLLGRQITITDNAHGTIKEKGIHPKDKELYSKGPVIIGNRTWIGDKVTILPGIILGDDVIVGANSVVTKSFASGSVIAGNPARQINKI